MINIKNDLDVSVLKFIKALYKNVKYDKDEVKRLLHPNVIEAVMKTIDVTERGK